LNNICIECGVVVKSRAYVPHVTLAKKINISEYETDVSIPEWTVNKFALFESVDVPDGVVYRELKRWLLS
jgi:2'-5' RNA ligase